MKTFTNIIVAGLATIASAEIQLEVRMSDTMIDVGTLDIMAVTRTALYAEPGNSRSVLTDRTFQCDTSNCKSAIETTGDITVQVKMTGAWGQTPGLSNNEMRDGLVSGLFEALTRVSDETGYELYTNCTGTTWQESVSPVPTAACGGAESASRCDAICKNDVASPGTTQCVTHTWAHKVPSTMRITAYLDNALQPDDLFFEFAATNNKVDGGCGIVGKIASGLAGYVIPVVGGLFSQGITLLCAS